MHPIIAKTFCGLTLAYYSRQLFFGLIIAALFIWLNMNSTQSLTVGAIAFATISTLLYPYSRFVYESIVGFIRGDKTSSGEIVVVVYNDSSIWPLIELIVKLIMMILCWAFAIFIAPIGLGYLYFYHSKTGVQSSTDNSSSE